MNVGNVGNVGNLSGASRARLSCSLLAGLALVFWKLDASLVVVFFLLALSFGVLMTLPIGGADMPVVISLYNALTGLAVAFEGYVLQNEALIIAGMVVGAAGTMLTQLMAKAMNRSLFSVLFGSFGDSCKAWHLLLSLRTHVRTR